MTGLREVRGHILVLTDAPLGPGFSGGPLVGGDGRLLGVVSFRLLDGPQEGTAFAVAAGDVARDLGIRWDTSTAATLFGAVAEPGAADRWLDLVGIGPGPGVALDPSSREADRRRHVGRRQR